jgi:hypothetical protein
MEVSYQKQITDGKTIFKELNKILGKVIPSKYRRKIWIFL